MTLREAIEEHRSSFPCEFGDDVLTRWISELEDSLIDEVVLTHEGAPESAKSFSHFTPGEDEETELFAKGRHSRIYPEYLRMKCDAAYGDASRYDVSSALFAASYADFADSYNRAHRPLPRAGELKTK